MSPLVPGTHSGYTMQNNMAAKKVFELNEASIVDLKAELIRKESQLKREKFGEEQKVNRQPKKPPVWAKVKKETKPTNLVASVQQNELSLEEQQLLQKSRQVLEAKAALYDKMAQGEIEDEEDSEGEGRFLVDFHKKVYSKEEESEQNSEGLKDEDIPPPSGLDEEWVDYVDSLGRERRCLRKDLKQLQDMDKDITGARKSPPTLLSEDMRRELMRQQWEKEEEEAMNKPVGPLHYQDIRFDEIRTHGVGYYQFSTNEEERQEQMKALDKLREQTLEQRVRAQKLKDKRKAALDARLAKVRERKLKKLKASDELSAETTEENMDTKDKEEEAAKGSDENKRNRVFEGGDEKIKTENEEEGKFAALRRPDKRQGLPEWALHKIKQTDRRSQSSRSDPREERDDLFAPPAFYYEDNTPERRDKNTRKEPNLFRNEKSINERKQELKSQNQEASNQRQQPQYQPQAEQSRTQQQQQQQHSPPPLHPPEYPPLPPPPTQGYIQAAWTGYQWQPPPSIPPPPIPQQLPWQPNFPFNVPPPPPSPWQPNTFAWQSSRGSQPMGTVPFSGPRAFTTRNSSNSNTFLSRGPVSDTRQPHAHSVEHKDKASENNKTEERAIPSNQEVADFVAQFRS